jgi:capsular exopolysaccharide synthesis family protein
MIRRLWPLPAREVVGYPRLIYDEGKLPHARALEAYRSLRTALLLSHSGKPPQTILVTSALPGEGKSTTAANTAIALAQTGARTLIVDLDMRKPSLDEAFGIAAEQGMSTFLSGMSDFSSQIRETGLPNLLMVPAGPRAPNPAELIGSKRMATGMQLMREYFTYVVIDSPPVLELSDAMVVSQYVDGVIVVARGGRTPRKAVQRASDQLLQVGAKLLGVLVNNVRPGQSGYNYYGSMGSYYERYYSDSESNQRTA